LFLPVLVEELNAAGVSDKDILIVFATGIHRTQTPDEHKLILGEEIHRRIRHLDHRADDPDAVVGIGTTSFGNRVTINRHIWESDRVIVTGEIIHHLIAGYSGGRKGLVPGVAGAGTTTFNHAMIFDPRCEAGRLDGNPAHEDMLEACRMVEPDFLLNVILGPEGELLRVIAGHYEFAHREGCRFVDEALCAPIDGAYDLLVASAGGFPLDIDLRQAHKGLENACRALRPGGSILFFAECPNGAGHPRFTDFINQFDNADEMERQLRVRF
jgi:nickel-dependent lactate racemase